MRLLLDTHCWLWMQVSPGVFAPQVRKLLEDPHQELLLSSASVWEISIKWSSGHRDRARRAPDEDTLPPIDVCSPQ